MDAEPTDESKLQHNNDLVGPFSFHLGRTLGNASADVSHQHAEWVKEGGLRKQELSKHDRAVHNTQKESSKLRSAIFSDPDRAF